MGLGKTVIILTLINYLINSCQIRGAIIFAPLRVCYNVWPDEIGKWDHLKHLSFSILHGSGKDQELETKKDVYITNYDSLAWLYKKLSGYKRDQFPFDMIVFDESTAIKNPQTKRFKYFRNIIKAFKRRVILTATPAPNSLEDLWAQFFLLDDGKRLGTSRYWFKENYFYTADYHGYKWVPFPDTPKILSKKVEDIAVRIKAEEYLQMPKKIDNNVFWTMSDKTKKEYRRFEQTFLAEIGDEQVVAVNAAALSTKLRQYLSGFLYAEEATLDVHTEKLDVLSELMEEIQNPAIVAIQFRHEYDMILKRFPGTPVIYGGISPKLVKSHINEWNKGKLTMIVVHPASLAHGVNIQHGGNNLVWYSIPWSYEHYTQLIGRLYRQGQEKPVIIHHLLAKNTVETDVAKALQEKETNEVSFTKQLIKTLREKNDVHC